ncbi:MAG: S8 family peptidase [Gemmatimonadaceae bacterium]
MKRLLAVTVSALALAACSDASNPPSSPASPQQIQVPLAPVYSKGDDGIPNDYIVVYKEGVVTGTLSRAAATVANLIGTPKFSYDAVLNGFAATLTPEQLAKLRANPNIEYIEQDAVIELSTTQSGATWGIDRIDQRNRPLSGTYTYTSTGAGVTAYIIDTGIQTSHPQFGGRAAVAYDALGGNGQDCNGHGTHVAGTVGSSTYGVAKGVQLRAVRVLNCSGSGSTSGVIAGMNWVANNHVAKSVANMSLGGGYSSATNTAANNLASKGVFLAVAAGNSNANACNSSPSSAANVTSVAASTSTDAKASYSNYGSCVHLYAPGSSITSTWLSGGTNTISGTSMASPHVAGVAALYKATFGDASYSTIRTWLTTNATSGVITGNPSGTPNRLLYKSTL